MNTTSLIELQELWNIYTALLEEKAGMAWRINNSEGMLPFFRVDCIVNKGVWFLLASPEGDTELFFSWEDLGYE